METLGLHKASMKQKFQWTSTTHFFGSNSCFVPALTKTLIPTGADIRFLKSALREKCQFCLPFSLCLSPVCLLWSERTRRFWRYSSPSIFFFGKGDTGGLLPARAPEPGGDVCQQGSLSRRHWEVSEPAGKGGWTLEERASQWAEMAVVVSAGPNCTSHPNYTPADSFSSDGIWLILKISFHCIHC